MAMGRWSKGVAVAAVAMVAVADVAAQSPVALVSRAVTAMGGEAALRSVTALSTSFSNVSIGLGQEELPGAPGRTTFFSGQSVSDYAGTRRFVVQESRPTPSFAFRLGITIVGDVGVVNNNGSLLVAQPGQIESNLRVMRLQPDRLLLAALDEPKALQATAPRLVRGEMSPGVRLVGRDTVSIYFDQVSGLPVATETLTDDPVLGDRHTLTVYSRWQESRGVRFSRQQDAEVNGRPLSHTVVTALTANPGIADSVFAIPDSLSVRAPRGRETPIAVVLASLAPGLWRAEGGSHHSLVVEQPTGVVLFEAPTNALQTRALLDTIRSRFPGKPVTAAVMSHHHWDHSGGIREVLASGVPVVAHARNVNFVRQIAAAPKRLVPDALSRGARRAMVRGVNDSLVLGSGQSRLVVYPLPNSHTEGLVVGYHPASRTLFVVDVLSPDGGPLQAAASAEVVAMVAARKIPVDRVVGGHGDRAAAWSDVERAARP